MEGLCDQSTELSDNAFLRHYPWQAQCMLEQTCGCFTYPADLPTGVLLLCKSAPWMGGWSLGSPAGYRPLTQHVKAGAKALCSKRT